MARLHKSVPDKVKALLENTRLNLRNFTGYLSYF